MFYVLDLFEFSHFGNPTHSKTSPVLLQNFVKFQQKNNRGCSCPHNIIYGILNIYNKIRHVSTCVGHLQVMSLLKRWQVVRGC